SFEKRTTADHGPIDWTGLTSIRAAKSAMEIGSSIALFAVVVVGLELVLRWTNTPTYVFPKPIAVVRTLANEFTGVYAHHLWVTMYEFLSGYAIGAAVGLLLAALITQKPFAEKVIAPYILIMVTTPMIALVPFLRLKMGFGSWPLIIAVALAAGPMRTLSSATGF